jgi:hypothetical protein
MTDGREVKGHKMCFAWYGRFANVVIDITIGENANRVTVMMFYEC